MNTVVIAAPTSTPISVDDVIANSYIATTNEYALIQLLIEAATKEWENVTGMALRTQTLEDRRMSWPNAYFLTLQRRPVQSITSVSYVDKDGNTSTISSSAYYLDDSSNPRIWLNYGESWPTATLRPGPSIMVRYVAGYTNADLIPSDVRQCLLMAVGEMYENRERTIVQPGIVKIELPWWRNALYNNRIVTI